MERDIDYGRLPPNTFMVDIRTSTAPPRPLYEIWAEYEQRPRKGTSETARAIGAAVGPAVAILGESQPATTGQVDMPEQLVDA